MPDNKLSLEDILKEYSSQNENSQTSVRRVDAQKILNSTVTTSSTIKPRNVSPPQSHKKSDLFENALRQSSPADEFKPADLIAGQMCLKYGFFG